jgi:hypothetical protein
MADARDVELDRTIEEVDELKRRIGALREKAEKLTMPSHRISALLPLAVVLIALELVVFVLRKRFN